MNENIINDIIASCFLFFSEIFDLSYQSYAKIFYKEMSKKTNTAYVFPIKKKEYILRNDLIIKNKRQYIKSTYKCLNILAYDTETYKGKCKLLCRNIGKPLLNPSFKECLDYLFYLANDKYVYRFFFNIDFDISAILKLWNNIEQINYLRKGIQIIYEGYKLTWLKGHLFIIRNIKRKKSVIFTDLNNFYHLGLNQASEKYLNNLQKDIIDGNKLNNDLNYWNKNLEKIKKYCIKDCILTQKLAKLLIDTIEKSEIPLPKYLVSSASLSKQNFRLKCYIPSISHIPEKIIQIGYDTYYGGRFEIFKRGFFNKAFLYDINSQYPSFIRKLPNLIYGIWKWKTKALNHLFIISKNKKICLPMKETFGYFKVKLKIPYDVKIPTIPIKYNNIIKFPNGIFEGWFTWYDLDLMRKYIITIYESYIFYEGKLNYKPFKDQIDFLYKKKQLVKGKNQLLYNIYKLTMNALYGCFVEKHKIEYIDKPFELKSGIMFNCVYGSQITAFGRWSVIKKIPKKIYKNIIAIHTDSIIANIPLTKYLKIDNKIGNWNLEEKGKLLILNTGMYQINDMIKTRGIPKKYIGFKNINKKGKESWFNFCKKNKNKIEKIFKIKRMKKLSEALIQDKSMIKVNTFQNKEKTVHCNSDTKRDWFRDFNNFNDVLTSNIKSYPFILFDIKGKLYENPISLQYRYENT